MSWGSHQLVKWLKDYLEKFIVTTRSKVSLVFKNCKFKNVCKWIIYECKIVNIQSIIHKTTVCKAR